MGCSLQGALAHAKNGDEVFWEEKFHVADGKAQACTQGALFFFFLCFGVGGGRRIFFSFFPISQCVRTMFLSSSQWVPNIFRNIFSIPPHFYMPWKMVSSFHLYRWAKGKNCTVQNITFCFGEFPLFYFFWNDGPIKLARCPKKTWEAPHLINRRGDYFPKFISLPLA